MPIQEQSVVVTPSPRVMGCDVSFWQDDNGTARGIDFEKMKAAGAKFVFIRAGQDAMKDPDFEYNWREARKAGLLRGAYFFFDYRHSAVQQARFFASLLAVDRGELPPVLDLEYRQIWGMPLRSNLLPAIQTFFATLEAETLRPTMFYTNPDMLLNILKPIPDWLFTGHPLWVAHYRVSEPRHDGWPTWTIWQHTDRGDGARFGVESRQIDMDWFNGSEAALYAFAGQQQPAPVLGWPDALYEWARSMGYNGPGPG